jgi:hypothetical protein
MYPLYEQLKIVDAKQQRVASDLKANRIWKQKLVGEAKTAEYEQDHLYLSLLSLADERFGTLSSLQTALDEHQTIDRDTINDRVPISGH